jgi:hypothetical protein
MLAGLHGARRGVRRGALAEHAGLAWGIDGGVTAGCFRLPGCYGNIYFNIADGGP